MTLYKLCIHYIYYTICRWDAYVTGVIFASELRLLGAKRAEDIYAEAGECVYDVCLRYTNDICLCLLAMYVNIVVRKYVRIYLLLCSAIDYTLYIHICIYLLYTIYYTLTLYICSYMHIFSIYTGNKMFMLHSLYHMNLDPACPSSIFKYTGLLLHIYNIPTNTLQDDISAVFISIGYDRNRLEYIWIDGTSLFITITGAGKEDEIRILQELRKRSELCKVEKEVKLSIIDSILLKHEQNMNRVILPQPIVWIVESLDEYNAREDSIAITTNNTSTTNATTTAATIPTTAVEDGEGVGREVSEGGDKNSNIQTSSGVEGEEGPGAQKRMREENDSTTSGSLFIYNTLRY